MPTAVSGVVSDATDQVVSLDDSDKAVGQPTPTNGPDSSTSKINKTAVRAVFQARLNGERADRGRQRVNLRPELRNMGNEHAANMAKHGYIGHEWPDGTTIEDRYEQRGLLPECQLEMSGSDRYYPGAENAAGGWIGLEFTVDSKTYYPTTEEELGEAFFQIWMNSDPHRRAMLVPSADEMGLGLHIQRNGRVYAALELC